MSRPLRSEQTERALDDHGPICGFVKDAAGLNRCASHKGTTYVYTAAPAAAPDWYRLDY